MAILWQQINPITRDAANLAIDGYRNLSNAFQSLGANVNSGIENEILRRDILDQKTRANNTQLLLNQLNQVDTLDKLNQYQNSGLNDLSKLRSIMHGGDFDEKAVNSSIAQLKERVNNSMLANENMRIFSPEGRAALNQLAVGISTNNADLVKQAILSNNLPLNMVVPAGNAGGQITQNNWAKRVYTNNEEDRRNLYKDVAQDLTNQRNHANTMGEFTAQNANSNAINVLNQRVANVVDSYYPDGISGFLRALASARNGDANSIDYQTLNQTINNIKTILTNSGLSPQVIMGDSTLREIVPFLNNTDSGQTSNFPNNSDAMRNAMTSGANTPTLGSTNNTGQIANSSSTRPTIPLSQVNKSNNISYNPFIPENTSKNDEIQKQIVKVTEKYVEQFGKTKNKNVRQALTAKYKAEVGNLNKQISRVTNPNIVQKNPNTPPNTTLGDDASNSAFYTGEHLFDIHNLSSALSKMFGSPVDFTYNAVMPDHSSGKNEALYKQSAANINNILSTYTPNDIRALNQKVKDMQAYSNMVKDNIIKKYTLNIGEGKTLPLRDILEYTPNKEEKDMINYVSKLAMSNGKAAVTYIRNKFFSKDATFIDRYTPAGVQFAFQDQVSQEIIDAIRAHKGSTHIMNMIVPVIKMLRGATKNGVFTQWGTDTPESNQLRTAIQSIQLISSKALNKFKTNMDKAKYLSRIPPEVVKNYLLSKNRAYVSFKDWVYQYGTPAMRNQYVEATN